MARKVRKRRQPKRRGNDNGLDDDRTAPAPPLHPRAARLSGGDDRRSVHDPARIVEDRHLDAERRPGCGDRGLVRSIVAGPIMFVVLLGTMWLPASVGIMISEAFAIRSWIFHRELNGRDIGFGRLADVRQDRRIGRADERYDDMCSPRGLRAASPIGSSRAGARASGSRCSRGHLPCPGRGAA